MERFCFVRSRFGVGVEPKAIFGDQRETGSGFCEEDIRAGIICGKKRKMHPSFFDESEKRVTKVLRCSPRLLSMKQSQTQHSLNLSSPAQIIQPSFAHPSILDEKRSAEVPTWTGLVSESDSKWLGTPVWPLKTLNPYMPIEREPIGRGRQDSCGCEVSNSVECVRFHIAEKTARLKTELGNAFYDWYVDQMGESLSLDWSEEDKMKFECTLKSNLPPLSKWFWDEIFKTLPNKSRADVVNYYFNVSLLQRREFQNRCIPGDTNSDEDDDDDDDDGESQITSSSSKGVHQKV